MPLIESLMRLVNPWVITMVMGFVCVFALRFKEKLTNSEGKPPPSIINALDILNSIPCGLIQIDHDWKITFINTRARDLLTKGRDLTGCDFWRLFPEPMNELIWRNYQQAVMTRRPVEFEEAHGEPAVPYIVQLHARSDGLTLSYREAPQWERTPDTPVSPFPLLYGALEAMPSGIFVLDVEGSIQHVNAVAGRIWAAHPGSLMDMGNLHGYWSNTGLPIKPSDWPMLRTAVHGEMTIGASIDIRDFDGNKHGIVCSSFPIRDKNGTRVGAVAIFNELPKLLDG